jgi:hypothetical protein
VSRVDVVVLLGLLAAGLAYGWRRITTTTPDPTPVEPPAVLAPADSDLIDWCRTHPSQTTAPDDTSTLDSAP